MTGPDVDCSVVRYYRRTVEAAAVLVVGLGGAGLAGWAWRVPWLTALPGTAAIRPNTAVCLVVLGVSLWSRRPDAPPRWRRAGAAGAALVLLVAATTVVEYVTGAALPVDRLLFGSDPDLEAEAFPGRMAPHTATGLLLLGAALLTLPVPADPPGRRVVAGQVLALAAGALGMLGLYGYAYYVPEFASPLGVTAVSVHSAVALTVGSIAAFLACPTGGPARILVARAKSAMMTRRILLAILLIPPTLGWLRLFGEDRGVFGPKLGVALLVAANGAIFLVIAFITGARAVRLEVGRRQAEDALAGQRAAAAMAEAAPDAMVGVDGRGVVVLVNAATEELLGRPRTDLLGRPVDRFVPPDAARWFRAAHRAGARRPGPEAVLAVRHRDGTETPAEINLSTVDTGGRRLVVGTLHDVTERVRYEDQLRDKNAQLEQANHAKDTFLATMSHELRTPLNSIIGFTGTLLMGLPGPLTDQQTNQLRLVETAGQHLLSLIDDILELAKIEAGRLEVRAERVDCTAVVREVTEYMRPLADQKGLPLIVDLPEQGCAAATADRRALGQILINLIGNAIKFTAAGEVGVVLRREEPDGPWTVAVRDTGPGIEPGDEAGIFRAFHRTAEAHARRLDGAGLGLYISHTLADLMGCRIRLASRPGHGTTFTLVLKPDQAGV